MLICLWMATWLNSVANANRLLIPVMPFENGFLNASPLSCENRLPVRFLGQVRYFIAHCHIFNVETFDTREFCTGTVLCVLEPVDVWLARFLLSENMTKTWSAGVSVGSQNTSHWCFESTQQISTQIRWPVET